MAAPIYIKPKEGIISWTLRYGELLQEPPLTHVRNMKVACVIERREFGPVLRVCFNQLELHDARNVCNSKGYTCRWFYVPIQHVRPMMHGQEIR